MQSAIQSTCCSIDDDHVAEHRRAARPGDDEQVGEAGDRQAEVGARAVRPLRRASDTPSRPRMSIVEQRAGHGVEAGGEDDRVELVLAVRRAHAARRDLPIGVARRSTSVTLSRLNVS